MTREYCAYIPSWALCRLQCDNLMMREINNQQSVDPGDGVGCHAEMSSRRQVPRDPLHSRKAKMLRTYALGDGH